ncbi:MAG: DUF3080 family protein [Gammaproteobacteria bacterium]
MRKAYLRAVRKSSLFGFILAFGAAVAASGCGRDPSLNGVAEVAAAAAAVAGRPGPAPPPVPRPYPSARDRVYASEDIRIGMLDFFALKRCGIRGEVADRNSILGKLAEASRRLPYEHALVLGLEACVARLADDPEDDDPAFAATIAEALEAVRSRLPAIRWNAGFGSDEFAASFRVGAGPLPAGVSTAQAQKSALETLAQAIGSLGKADAAIDRKRVVDAQETLEKGRYGARLHRSLAAATHYLRDAAESVDLVSSQGCPAESLARIRATMVDVRLVPWLDELEARGEAWFRGIAALAAVSPPPPPGFRTWATEELYPSARDGRWQKFLAARAAFTGALARCADVSAPAGNAGYPPTASLGRERKARPISPGDAVRRQVRSSQSSSGSHWLTSRLKRGSSNS